MEGYVMKVSRNGQISIPARTRARWGAERVRVLDLGDRIVVRPVLADPVRELMGKYAGPGPTTDEMRREARAEESAAERRRNR